MSTATHGDIGATRAHLRLPKPPGRPVFGQPVDGGPAPSDTDGDQGAERHCPAHCEPRRTAAYSACSLLKRAEPRDYLALAAEYAEGVREGRIVACQPIRWEEERQDRD